MATTGWGGTARRAGVWHPVRVVRIVPELPGDDPDEATSRWRDDVGTRITALDDRLELTFDFAPASLDPLELEVARRHTDDDDLDDPLTAGVIAYLGETFMRAGGGRWIWRGEPVVVFDPGLPVADLAPRRLLIDGAGFRSAYEQVAAAARETAVARQAAEPGWEPTKLATLGVDPYEPDTATGVSTGVEAWRADQRAAFDRWTGGERGWDFTPESLDRLEDAVRADPGLAGLGAWYFGEVLVRTKGATWQASSGEPGQSTFAGRQWVQSARDSIADAAVDRAVGGHRARVGR